MQDRIRRFARCFPVSVLPLTVLASVLAVTLAGCPFGSDAPDNLDYVDPGNRANHNQPKPEMPPAAADGPIGPMVTHALGFTPVAVPGTPTVMPGGHVLLVDPTVKTVHGHQQDNRLIAVRINVGDWEGDRENQTYRLPMAPMPFPFVTNPEEAVSIGTNRDNDLCVVMFRKLTGHYGSYRMSAKDSIELPKDAGFDAPLLRGFAAGPVGKSFLMATATGVHEVTLGVDDSGIARVTPVMDAPVAAITGTARHGHYVITTDSVIHRLQSGEEGWSTSEVARVEDAPGEPLAIEVAIIGGKPVMKVRYPATTWLAGTKMAGHVAFLPGDRLAWLTGGKLVIVARAAPDAALATLEGLPADASWIGADPDGGAVAALAGDKLTSVILDLDHPAYSSTE